MSNIKDNFIPTPEDIAAQEEAMLNKEEAALEAEENAAIEGGDLGRVRSRRNRSRDVRRRTRTSAARRSFAAGAKAKETAFALVDSLTSRGHFELRKSVLPAHVQADLKSGASQVVDSHLYAVKALQDKTSIDLIVASDDRTVGVTNLNRAQLDQGKYFLLTGIVLEYGTHATETNPAMHEYGASALPAEILNGTFEMKLGTKVLVPEMSCGAFDKTQSDKRNYLYKLDNPKWLTPGTDITPTLSLVKGILSGNPAVKITLVGCSIEKA